MPLLVDSSFLATCPDDEQQSNIGLIENGALAWEGEEILWVGATSEVPEQYQSLPKIDVSGGCIIPALIDCHTHLAFGGWREDEFEKRICGVSYLEIAQSGGGILSTVEKTRRASEEELLALCESRLKAMNRLGITTVECKSGYGLNREDELKQLRVYQELQKRTPATIVPTLLAAHTFPAEFNNDRDGYIELVCSLIKEVSNLRLASFCDIFVEESAFSLQEARKVLSTAREYGLSLKLHADQLSSGAGAELAGELGAVSADHLECISDQGIAALKSSGTVAVTLPVASLYTFQKPLDARRLLDAGIPVAVATDFNPGSAPTFHLPFALVLACTLNRMTPAEALKGATVYAARALRLNQERGTLAPGKRADICVLNTPSVDHWLYHFSENCCRLTVAGGTIVYQTTAHSSGL